MSDFAKFMLVVGGMCLFYPPFLGLVLGVAGFCVVWFIIFKLIGG